MDPGSPFHQDPGTGVLSLRILHPSAPPEVPLRYVRSNGQVCVLAQAEPAPAWAATLIQAHPTLYWRIGGQGFLGIAQSVDDSRELDAVRARFDAAFGAAVVRGWFGARPHGFVFEVIGTDALDYPILVERYFDALADSYDRVVQRNPLDARLRSVAGGILSSAFHADDLVLEIGSGTGLETLPLARKGVRIVATDISQRMLDRLRQKATAEGLDDLIITRRLRAGNLDTILHEFGPSRFGGAFSNFGALNCESDLSNMPSVLSQLLREKARVVLGVWNRVCLMEMLIYLAIARPRRAFSRFLDPVPVGNSRFGIPTFAKSPGPFARAFSPFFRIERVVGLPVFLPPYDLASRLADRADLVSMLESIDGRLADHAPFNTLGDHFIVELIRR